MHCHTDIDSRYGVTSRSVGSNRRSVAAEWYEQFSERLVGYLIQHIHSAADAEDIAHEAFLHVLSVSESEPILNPKALLFATAMNLLRDHCRRAHTRAMLLSVSVDDVEILDECDPSQIMEGEQALAQISETLEHLRPATRRAFLFDRVELLSHTQIAERLHVTRSMVEKHIRYAMDAFETIGFEQPRRAGGKFGGEGGLGRAPRVRRPSEGRGADRGAYRQAPTTRGRRTAEKRQQGVPMPVRQVAVFAGRNALSKPLSGYGAQPSA